MIVKLMTEHLEFLSLKGGCTGSYEFTLVKMPHCWKSHATAHIGLLAFIYVHSRSRKGSDETTHEIDTDRIRSRECSGESAHARMLASAFPARKHKG